MIPETILLIWYVAGVLALLFMCYRWEREITVGNLALSLLLGLIAPIIGIICLLEKCSHTVLYRAKDKE